MNHEADALKIASTAHNSQYTLSDGATGFSSLHYSTESANSATTASGHATTASGHADNAQDWAVKVNGIVDSTDYSSKAHAIGGRVSQVKLVLRKTGRLLQVRWTVQASFPVRNTLLAI